MSADHSVHVDDEIVPPHDLAAEAEHARHHAVANNWFFLSFFTLILFAVACYEFTGNSLWSILLLGAARVALIATFLFSLIRPFSLVVATLIFTVGFFSGMVGLSLWAFGNPIVLPTHH